MYENVLTDPPGLWEGIGETPLWLIVIVIAFAVFSGLMGAAMVAELTDSDGAIVGSFVAVAAGLVVAFGSFMVDTETPRTDPVALEANLQKKYAVSDLLSDNDEYAASYAADAYAGTRSAPEITLRLDGRSEAVAYELQIDPETSEPFLVGIDGTHSPDPDSLLRDARTGTKA